MYGIANVGVVSNFMTSIVFFYREDHSTTTKLAQQVQATTTTIQKTYLFLTLCTLISRLSEFYWTFLLTKYLLDRISRILGFHCCGLTTALPRAWWKLLWLSFCHTLSNTVDNRDTDKMSYWWMSSFVTKMATVRSVRQSTSSAYVSSIQKASV